MARLIPEEADEERLTADGKLACAVRWSQAHPPGAHLEPVEAVAIAYMHAGHKGFPICAAHVRYARDHLRDTSGGTPIRIVTLGALQPESHVTIERYKNLTIERTASEAEPTPPRSPESPIA